LTVEELEHELLILWSRLCWVRL